MVASYIGTATDNDVFTSFNLPPAQLAGDLFVFAIAATNNPGIIEPITDPQVEFYYLDGENPRLVVGWGYSDGSGVVGLGVAADDPYAVAAVVSVFRGVTIDEAATEIVNVVGFEDPLVFPSKPAYGATFGALVGEAGFGNPAGFTQTAGTWAENELTSTDVDEFSSVTAEVAYGIPQSGATFQFGTETGQQFGMAIYAIDDTPTENKVFELGCGTQRLVITDRCGAKTVCELTDDLNSLEYGRVMDDTSRAKAVVGKTGGVSGACCQCVGNLRTWLHSGVIYRSGKLVWGPGPITNIRENTGSITLTIKDISAWLDRRLVHAEHNFVNTDIVQIAVQLITDAMAPDDPCDIIGNLQVLGEGTKIDYQVAANRIRAGDALRDLARLGLDFTVLGTSIILAPALSFGPYTTLMDNDFLTDIEVEERGEDAATEWVVAGEAVSGSCGGIDPVYGLIEQLAQEDNLVDADSCTVGACNRLQASNPAPVFINVPDDAQLAAKAPVNFEHLVPGLLLPVNLTQTCRKVAITNRLTAMNVKAEAGDERVGITLAPLGTNVDEASGSDF